MKDTSPPPCPSPEESAALMREIVEAAAVAGVGHDRQAGNFKAMAELLTGPFGRELAPSMLVETELGNTRQALRLYADDLEHLAAAVRHLVALIEYHSRP